ncbi:MAG: large conductance mechanosensitive channel protein MscL [Clostridiales bacterium]|jgi:large conductance mechanosensitive channel|nr:large conductance mechanosensitive channel protein MscL [Clostridiales bacterium]
MKGKLKGFFADFKSFITKGNIIGLAVAVVVGGAFGAIVTSLVNDIIMPLVTLAVGGLAVTDWKWVITEAAYDDAGVLVKAESALRYGNFIQTVINFLIIALCIFLALRIGASIWKKLNAKKLAAEAAAKKAEEEEAAKKAAEAEAAKGESVEKILSDIRALLAETKK